MRVEQWRIKGCSVITVLHHASIVADIATDPSSMRGLCGAVTADSHRGVER